MKIGAAGIGLAFISLILNLLFWLGLIFGGLWAADHFGVI